MKTSFSFAAQSLLLAGGLFFGSHLAAAQDSDNNDLFTHTKKKYKNTLTHIQFPRSSEKLNDAAKRRLMGARDAALSSEGETAYIEIGHDGIPLDTAMIRKELQRLKRIKSDHHTIIVDGATVDYHRTADTTRVYVGSDFQNPHEADSTARIPAADVFRIIGETLTDIADSKDEEFYIIVETASSMRLAPNMARLPVNTVGLFMTNIDEALTAPRYGILAPAQEWSFGTQRNFDYTMESALIATLDHNDAPHLVIVQKGQDSTVTVNKKTVFDTPGKKLAVVNLKGTAEDLPQYFKRREFPGSQDYFHYYSTALLSVPLKTLFDAHKEIPKGGSAPNLKPQELRLVEATLLERILAIQKKGDFEKDNRRRDKRIFENGSDWFNRAMVERHKPDQKLAIK